MKIIENNHNEEFVLKLIILINNLISRAKSLCERDKIRYQFINLNDILTKTKKKYINKMITDQINLLEEQTKNDENDFKTGDTDLNSLIDIYNAICLQV